MLRYMHVHLHWCEARDTLSAIATEEMSPPPKKKKKKCPMYMQLNRYEMLLQTSLMNMIKPQVTSQ